MHRIKVLSGILVLTALLGSAMIVAPAAQASGPGAGEAYYLFYRVIKDIHKSCPGNVPGYFIKDAGPANLRPYRKYRTVSAGVTKGGSFQTLKWWEDAFSTADRQEWCYKGDFVYKFYGEHKVRRLIEQNYFCGSLGCQYLFTHYGPWRNDNWS